MQENRLSGPGGFVVYAVAIVLLVFIVAPLAVVIVMSFSEANLAMFPVKGFTLDWYSKVIADPQFRASFGLSAMLAGSVTLSAVCLGVPAAYALDRSNFAGKRGIEALLLSPLMLPSLIIGVAMLQFFASIGLFDTRLKLFIGHTMITLPYMIRTVTASLKLVNPSLEDAARTLGAPPHVVFMRVTVPQIMAGVSAGILFALMISFDEFSISMWLYSAEAIPLPIHLHHQLSKVFDPSVAAISSLMVLTGFFTALERIVGLRKAMGV